MAVIENIERVIMENYCSFFPRLIVDSSLKIYRLSVDYFSPQVVPEKIILNFNQKNKHVFFGYYDITPFSSDDKMLLAMQAPLINKAPRIEDEADVGFYQLNDCEKKFHFLGKTSTWCWQQGCRLQWYPGGKNKIVYNFIEDGEYKALVVEVPTGKIINKIIKPIYSISPDGRYAVSLDFSRLQRLRPGYGYGIISDKSAKDFRPDYSGIELIDLEKNKSQLIFSLKQICEISPLNSMLEAEHYFNHLMFNPSGKKFLFMHFWKNNYKKYSRIFVANRNGTELKLINNSGKVSHYNWISENEIILYSALKKSSEYEYAVFNCENLKIKFFGKNIPKENGHPTYIKEISTIITDTYPDLSLRRNLLCYNIKKDEKKILAKFDDPKSFKGESRCDLHPRINYSKNLICIDRLINNKRNMSLIPFNINSFIL